MIITTEFKYLIFREGLEANASFLSFLFHNPITHREMANFLSRMRPHLLLRSAGLCEVTLADGSVQCYNAKDYGSVRMASDDAAIIRRAFFN